jgi:prevent-host-death family protein
VINLTLVEDFPIDTPEAQLTELVDRVVRGQDQIVLTRHGKPAAVLISADGLDLDELEGFLETLAIQSDPDMVESIQRGQEELARGEGVPLDQVIADLQARRAPPDG